MSTSGKSGHFQSDQFNENERLLSANSGRLLTEYLICGRATLSRDRDKRSAVEG